MKRVLAAILTVAFLGGLVYFGGRQSPGVACATPTECVERMFQAAFRGDVREYLNCFAGPERAAIQRSLDHESQGDAAGSLRKTVSDLKGWAILDLPQLGEEAQACSLVVERVYAGRVDRQRLDLQRDGSEWRISSVDRRQPQQPAVPYGTPIYGESR